ncbi:MAG: hypothetical protein EPN82_14020 [Bacteroidetes bacterium]|nr:MAG: hypothetical protein EPN82_14020 [Bacteroidota bacterium]
MEETIGNTPSEMLNLLVDGELETSQEVSLYASLTESDELRNEMREILAIRESIRKDTEAFTPPRNARKSVLAAVGLAPGGVINAPITQVAVQTGFWGGFWGKIMMPVASAVVATIITSLMFMNFYKTGNNMTSTRSSLKNIPVVTSTENIANGEQTQNQKNNGIASPIKKSSHISSGIMPSIVPVPDAIIVENKDETALTNQIQTASLGTDLYKPGFLKYSNSGSNIIPVISMSPKQFESLSREKLSNLGITLVLRGIASRSFPTVELPSQANPLLRNVGLGGYVKLVDGLDVGLEIGQENYGLIYYNKEDGDYDNKNPILLWAGIGVKGKYNEHVDFLAGAKPFLQVFIGGTKIGPTGKIIGGLEYSWDSGLGFILGVEGSSLFYNQEQKWYSTEKLGFTYGMLYSF